MLHSVLRNVLSRRDLFRRKALALGAGLASGSVLSGASPEGRLELGPRLYESIGVRPVVNCRGTLTIIGGSQSLPEVKKAMDEASRHYVHIDELMDAVGQRIASLTGAEWGIVTAGCAAALAHVTAACIVGCDPERMQRLPDTSGLRNEVVVPGYSRNEYDHAIRMVGAKIVTVASREKLASAFTARTAMVMVLAGPEDRGEFGLPFISEIARAKGIPVLVDAAAEDLTIPNVHLQRGADVVCYSGGKVLRGPQCAGVALGRKDLLQAAWINSAPHHTFGRAMKIGREEIMGMLAAVEAWKTRDIAREYALKRNWLEHIAAKVQKTPGVTTEIVDTEHLSNHAPRMRVRWDPAKLGATGGDIAMALYEGSPRIDVGPSNRNVESPHDSIVIGAHMMMPGDEKIVADRLGFLLANPPKRTQTSSGTGVETGGTSLNGRWDVEIEFVRGRNTHLLFIEQNGSTLAGTHMGERLQGDLNGSISGSSINLKSNHAYEGKILVYRFEGEVHKDRMEGVLNLGEYGKARWTAVRHVYATPGAVQRPVKPA